MLNWSAWLRMHNSDPLWHQDVITKDSWEEMNWNKLNNLSGASEFWKVFSIDTTNLSKKEVAEKIAIWMMNILKIKINFKHLI